ncbi:hypothetical protein L209DRAFT_399142 [Thermothelomyces heterothallicus CBS 203.75]
MQHSRLPNCLYWMSTSYQARLESTSTLHQLLRTLPRTLPSLLISNLPRLDLDISQNFPLKHIRSLATCSKTRLALPSLVYQISPPAVVVAPRAVSRQRTTLSIVHYLRSTLLCCAWPSEIPPHGGLGQATSLTGVIALLHLNLRQISTSSKTASLSQDPNHRTARQRIDDYARPSPCRR